MRIYKTLMNKTFIYLLIAVLAACKSTPYSDETTKSDLRAPAYPLLTLHPHVKLWSMTDELNKQNMTFGGSTQLPFVGFLRVDGAMYRFMGSKELPMQAIAPMALDHEKWEGKFTSLVPDEGWEQPDLMTSTGNCQKGHLARLACGKQEHNGLLLIFGYEERLKLIRIFWSIKRFICAILMMMYFNCTSMGSNW